MDHTPGIEAVTGSLGQGLSISLGMALGLRLDKSDSRVFCIVGDGELDEGQIWEAAMAAAAHKVDNLVAIIDHNGVQATDTVENVLPTASSGKSGRRSAGTPSRSTATIFPRSSRRWTRPKPARASPPPSSPTP